MKRTTLLLGGCAALLVTASAWTSGARANPAGEAGPEVDLPLHRSCVVTVDPRIGPKPEYPGAANAISGFFAPDTARGTLIRLDSQWLVLRDGNEENWIPREKVLMIRASRQVHP
jgi:hypothetical protein